MTIIPAYRTRISKNWKLSRHRSGSDDQRLPAAVSVSGAPVRIKLRTPMLLRFRCNFVRLKDDLQLLNVPQTCASHGPKLPRASSSLPALSSGGLENERTTPRATFRRGKLSLQSNEIFGRTNPIPERSRRRASRCFSAVFSAGGSRRE